MLNSVNLANGHYSMKIKSMFDLAIASSTQRQLISSQNLYQSSDYPPTIANVHHQTHHQLYHQNNNRFVSSDISQDHISQNKLKVSFGKCLGEGVGGRLIMDEYSGGCGSNSSEVQLVYPRSPNSESSPKSASPVGSIEGSRTMSPPIPYNNNNNLVNPVSSSQQQPINLIGMTGEESNTGKVSNIGRNNNKHGVKSSFSIDALLAHSTNWRHPHGPGSSQNQSSGGKEIANKESRFFPYHIPQYQQLQQQGRLAPRHNLHEGSAVTITPVGNKPAVAAAAGGSPTEGDKRNEAFVTAKQGGPTGGNGRRPAKSKRVRTIFTPEQLERLEAEFERQQYMVGPERLYLASSLYLTEAQVKVWFQNRRIKWRKQHLELEQQRLAIYRTLAEQDMMASAEDEEEDVGESSPNCEYDQDLDSDSVPGGDEDQQKHQRNPHSPGSYPHHPHNHLYQTPKNPSPDLSPALHSTQRTPATSPRNSGNVHKSNTKSQMSNHNHQQPLSNERYERTSIPTSSTLSTKEENYHANAIQGVKN